MSRYEKDLNEREEANQRFALGNDGYRLYKAAPELLAVLQQVNQRLTDGSTESWQHLHMQIKTVISKARGE